VPITPIFYGNDNQPRSKADLILSQQYLWAQSKVFSRHNVSCYQLL